MRDNNNNRFHRPEKIKREYNMHKFTTGLIAGGIIGAAGVAWAMSDNKTRRRMAREGRRAVKRANAMVGSVHRLF